MPIKKPSKNFIKYTSLAFQMLFTITAGVLLGNYLDDKFEGGGLILALVSVFFVIAGIYIGIKDLIFPKWNHFYSCCYIL